MTVAVPPTDPYTIFTDTHPETLRLYRLLPEFLRRADEADTTCTGGYPFLRWLDLCIRWYGGVTELIDRFNYPEANTTSDLVDPLTANQEWIPWLAQLVNVEYSSSDVSTNTASWGFLRSFLDTNADGIASWWEWQGDSAPGANDGNTTWQDIQDANIAERSQLFSIRERINKRRSLTDEYTTARSANGYYDGSGPSIASAIRSVLGGVKYVWVGSRASLLTLGPVHPNTVTLTGSESEVFSFTKSVDLGSSLILPGTSGNYASTPDSAALSVTGDLEIVARVAAADWTPSADMTIVGKYGSAGQRSYRFGIKTTGVLTLGWSADGTAELSQDSSAPTITADAQWVKTTIDVVNGGNRIIAFYKAADQAIEPSSWTLVSSHTVAGNTSIFNGTAALNIGAHLDGAANQFAGRIHRAIVRSGIGGTVVLDTSFSSEAYGVTSFNDSVSTPITVNQSVAEPKARIYTGRPIKMAMERTTTDTVVNASQTYGNDVFVSNRTTSLAVGIGAGTATGVLPNGSRATVNVTVDFNRPGNCVVTATHTPNGGGASTVINAVDVTHAVSPPSGATVMTFGKGFDGTVYHADFDDVVCNLSEFAVTDSFLRTGAGVASTADTWTNNAGDSMTFNYTGTPYSGTSTVAPEWTRIHIVTRAAENPSDTVVLAAAEEMRPAGFEFVLHVATEGP